MTYLATPASWCAYTHLSQQRRFEITTERASGRSMRKVLLLEFNEICPPLLDRWMAAGKLVNFARFYSSAQVFTTIADVSDPDCLEPWIQWYSIHTGLPYDEHKICHLTDGPKADHPDI